MTKRDEGSEPGAQHCPNMTSQLIVFSVGYQLKMTGKKEMVPSTKLAQSAIRKNLHKHAHSMATGQTGRNRAQIHCTTASGTLISEPTKAFRRSIEMQTAGVQKGRPEDVVWAEAFTQVVRYCAENDEQITITDLCEKLK